MPVYMYVKVKNESVSCSVLSDYFVTPWTSPPGSSPCNSPGKNTGVGCHSPGDFPDPRIEPRSPALQVDSLLSEPPGKPHNKSFVFVISIISSSIGIRLFECLQLISHQAKNFLCAFSCSPPMLCCCCCLVTKLYMTLCNLMDCSTPGFPVLYYLEEFAQIHVH